jgi:GH25 family lysozyme M1 (1,4-beta-N-acetylmuramidase)
MRATGVGARHPATGRRARLGVALAVSVISVLLVAVPASPAVAATKVPGIDVSKWQGDVDWTAVASTPVRFVIMRATIGNTPTTPRSVDERYEEYLVGATANGLVVGAYHRANVGRADGDAIGEADYFVNHAQIAAGDVLPVLDIEERHGLTVEELQDWVRTWVQRVFARTGVRPMIYTSPNFWSVNMGGTTWFADHGYPLWIAHWGVPAPSVPAENWGGHGWTFWQWTSTGHVSGIVPNVDRDRFNGTGLLRGKIASLEVTPRAGGAVSGARIDCGSGGSTCERLANPDTLLTLAAIPDPGASLLRWTGDCNGAGSSPTCDVDALGAKEVSAVFGYPVHVEHQGSGAGTVSSSPARIECGTTCTAPFAVGSTVTLTAEADSASVFVGWGGGCSGGGATCSFPVSSPTDVVATFASVVSVEQDGAGTGFGWGRVPDPAAIGGSYRWERRAGASATYAFTGGAVTLFTMSGPAMGKGRIRIDGSVVGTFDGYAPAVGGGVRHRFEGQGPGPHALTVEVLGTKRPAATGTRVAVDALRWGGQTRRDPSPASAAWATTANGSASGGTFAISDARSAFARLGFTGTGVSLRTLRGPGMGRAQVWLDGSLVKVVDLYAPAAAFATVPLTSGLEDGAHTVRIVALGTHRAASAGNAVVVDRWLVI